MVPVTVTAKSNRCKTTLFVPAFWLLDAGAELLMAIEGTKLENVLMPAAATGSVPVFVPEEKVKLVKALEAILIVFPAVAPTATSAVIKM